jgi:hypothetical protein
MSRPLIAAIVVAFAVLAAGAIWILRPKPLAPAPTARQAALTPKAEPVVSTAPSPQLPSPTAAASLPSAPATPWAVVSEYYGDVEGQDYQAAWSLLGFDPGGETYSQFVQGYSCTGGQTLTETGSSGDQVSFDITAEDTCLGEQQTFTDTATVTGGKITAATITQTSGPGMS